MLANVDHLQKERIQAGAPKSAAEGGLVQQRRTRGHDHAIQFVIGDVLLDQCLAGVGAHVLVVAGNRDSRQTRRITGKGLHIHGTANIGAAVADIESDPHRFGT